MAVLFRKMSIKTPDGVNHPNALWRLTELHATLDGVRLVYAGWHSQAAYDAGSQPLTGAVKEYSLPPATISTLPDLETAIHGAGWGVALQTPEGPQPAEGEEDLRESFFSGSEEVSTAAP